MTFAAHVAEMNVTDDNGVSVREHLLEKERRGDSVPELDGPECPEELSYLYGYAMDLTGRSGAAQWGLAPLSYSTVRDWQEVTGWTVSPREVDALVRLDSVMRNAGRKETKRPEDKPMEIAPWPVKRNTDG